MYLGFLTISFIGNKLNFFVFSRFVERKIVFDLCELLLIGFFQKINIAIFFGFFQRQFFLNVCELLFFRFRNQHDFSVASLLLDNSGFLNFRQFPFAGFLDDRNIPLRSALFQELFVFNLFLLDSQFLIQHITLFRSNLKRLFVGDGFVLAGFSKCFLPFNLKQFELSVELFLSYCNTRSFFGIVNLTFCLSTLSLFVRG